MENNYQANVKYGHLLTALDELSDIDLQALYREARSWDSAFDECCLYELDELDEFITWDSDTVREFIRIGESAYYYADCYGWHGLGLQDVRAHLKFWNADLAECLADFVTLEYNYEDSCYEVFADSWIPWTFEKDADLIKAALCDLAYAQGFVSLARDEEQLENLYLEL